MVFFLLYGIILFQVIFMLININEYKEYLINYFMYPCDNTPEKRLENKKLLEQKYSDEYLEEIIRNTEDFIIRFLEICLEEDTTYIRIPLEFKVNYVFTNCTGGWSPDMFVPIDSIDEGKNISKHLLHRFLGEGFHIYFDENVVEYYDDEDPDMIIGNSYSIPELVIDGKKELIKEKYEQIKKLKQAELVRALKKRI